jgi:hypothetical protein
LDGTVVDRNRPPLIFLIVGDTPTLVDGAPVAVRITLSTTFNLN